MSTMHQSCKRYIGEHDQLTLIAITIVADASVEVASVI